MSNFQEECDIYQMFRVIRQPGLNASIMNSQCASAHHASWSVWIYVSITPVIILLGLIGNGLCIHIFTQRRMQRQTSSIFFVSMSAADILVLIFYVTPDWFDRGIAVLQHTESIKLVAVTGLCQLFLYLSYLTRFISVWMLVASTIERYCAVYHPLLRRRFFKVTTSKRIIWGLCIFSLILCLWKPLLSQVSGVVDFNGQVCGSGGSYEFVSFVSDSVYAASLSIIPSIFIFIFNALIGKRLLTWRHQGCFRGGKQPIQNQELLEFKGCKTSGLLNPQNGRQDILGIQFATLLVFLAICYLLLSWPYYFLWTIKWMEQWSYDPIMNTVTIHDILHNESNLFSFGGSSTEHSKLMTFTFPPMFRDSNELERSPMKVNENVSFFQMMGSNQDFSDFPVVRTASFVDVALPLARAAFYLNYSINFFLYTFASNFFRVEMKRVFTVRSQRRRMRELFEQCEMNSPNETLTHSRRYQMRTCPRG